MRKFIGSVLILFLLVGFSVNASEKDDLLIQVDLDDAVGNQFQCSILQVKQDGTLFEFVSSNIITKVTGEPLCDFEDTGMAAGLNGLTYFSEDESDYILIAYPNGAVRTFVTDDVVNTLFPNTVDWDNGMAINPVTGDLVAADEDNEAIVEFPTDVSVPITNPALINVLATEADFEALIGVDNVDLEGGIAIDGQENIYIANDGENTATDDVIFKLTAAGDLSILCSEAQLNAIPGVGPSVDLDVGMAIGDNLYVADDGDCDCVIQIDPNNCDNAQVLFSEDQIIALTGNDLADLEGGLCIDSNMNLFLGDDGDASGDFDRPNIVKIVPENVAFSSLFAGTDDIRAIYPLGDPTLQGSCTVKLVDADTVPTLSEWGMIAMAALLGLAGFIVARRRMINA